VLRYWQTSPVCRAQLQEKIMETGIKFTFVLFTMMFVTGCGFSTPQGPDSREAGTCTTDGECPVGTSCDQDAHVCVSTTACNNDDSNCAAGFICDGAVCREGCRVNSDCPAPQQCDGATLLCIDPVGTCPAGESCCESNGDCMAGEVCVSSRCVVTNNRCDAPGSLGCSGGQSCVNGQCVSTGCSSCSDLEICSANVCVAVQCTAMNMDRCAVGQVCDNYTCVTVNAGCTSDTQCPGATNVCRGGSCTIVQCTDNSHCLAGQNCESNVCVGANVGCVSDNDCPGRLSVCRSAQCVVVQCIDATDCADSQTCSGGICQGGVNPNPGTCTPVSMTIEFYDTWPVVRLSAAFTQSPSEYDVFQDGWREAMYSVNNANSLTFSDCVSNTRSPDLAVGAIRWNLAFCMGEGAGMCNPNDSACVGRENLGTAQLNTALISQVSVIIDGVGASLDTFSPPICGAADPNQCGSSCASSL